MNAPLRLMELPHPESGVAATTRATVFSPTVIAVVVTNDRPALLARLLDTLERQTLPVARIIVVDNGGSPLTPAVVDHRPRCERINGRANLGGAGGFALGMLHALTLGADLLWLMDDDGYPGSASTLEALHRGMEQRGWDAASPLVLDDTDPDLLAFPFKIGLRLFRDTAALKRREAVEGFAHLFNGLLIRSNVLPRTGVPDFRLFIRRDEIDFFFRMRATRLKFGTLTAPEFNHPSSRADIVPLIPGVLHAVWPADLVKQRVFFRNRGYVIRRHRLWWLVARDAVTYPWFFLVKRHGDVAGLGVWARAMWAGARDRF